MGQYFFCSDNEQAHLFFFFFDAAEEPISFFLCFFFFCDIEEGQGLMLLSSFLSQILVPMEKSIYQI